MIQQYHVPSLTCPAYGGGPSAYPGAGAYPWAFAASLAPAAPPVARPSAAQVKQEPSSAPAQDQSTRDKPEKAFLSQPMHVYVSGTDVGIVPAGMCWRQQCNCANRSTASGAAQGLHATWECPLRYIDQCGSCQGFFHDGSRDPAQWLPGGEVLTRAAKEEWVKLINRHKPAPAERAGGSGPGLQTTSFIDNSIEAGILLGLQEMTRGPAELCGGNGLCFFNSSLWRGPRGRFALGPSSVRVRRALPGVAVRAGEGLHP